MVDDLLDLAKVDAGRITVSPEWFEMVDLFAALRGMFKPILTSNAVSLIFEEPDSVPRIYSDDRRLSQILRNFISNALKFTKQGEVRVSAQLDRRPTDRVCGDRYRRRHRARASAALFADFVQIDTRLQRRLRGTGLGLSLSRKLAEIAGRTRWRGERAGRGVTILGRDPGELR